MEKKKINQLLLTNLDICYKAASSVTNNGFTEGKAGLILCMELMAKLTDSNRLKSQADHLLEAQLEGSAENMTLGYGLSAFCLALQWSSNKGVIDEQEDEINAMIGRECNLLIEKGKYDYYKGASGMLFYLLQCRNMNLSTLMQKYAFSIDKSIGENRLLTMFYDEDNSAHPCINFGTPHGITGYILLLLIALEQGYSDIVKPIVGRLCDFLLNSRYQNQEYPLFPSIVTTDGKKYGSNIAWCYGDLMAWYAIMKAGMLIGNASYQDLGYKNLLMMINRSDYRKGELCLCHGFPSLYLVFRKLYSITNDSAFKRNAISMKERSIDLLISFLGRRQTVTSYNKFIKNPSLFLGLPGCILALITDELDDDNWTKILLL